MRAVKSRDTKPELTVRRLLHGMGYRYRLHRSSLPGKPDIVFPGRRKTIFVHGCFWHDHDCPRGARSPKTNVDYWQAKRRGNKERDAAHVTDLSALGWKSLTIWECEVSSLTKLATKLKLFLAPKS